MRQARNFYWNERRPFSGPVSRSYNTSMARIRRKIREEKTTLSSVVENYNSLVTENLTLDTILSDDYIWPWQLTHGRITQLCLLCEESHTCTKSIMPQLLCHQIFKYQSLIQLIYISSMYSRLCWLEDEEEGIWPGDGSKETGGGEDDSCDRDGQTLEISVQPCKQSEGDVIPAFQWGSKYVFNFYLPNCHTLLLFLIKAHLFYI